MPALKKQTGKKKTRSRGRQPTFDRDEALDIALNLFWRHGYEGVSIIALTQSIGIAAPSLYHAFGSKEGLYLEALRRYQGMGLSESQITECASSLEAVQKVLEFGLAAVTRSKRPAGCMVSSGLLMASPEHTHLALQLRKQRVKPRVVLQRRIEEDIRAGILAPTVDAAHLARFYMTVLQGMSVQAIDGANSTDLKGVMEAALLAWPAPRGLAGPAER